MLLELWERMRGLDKWVETQATIADAKIHRDAVEYRDRYGTRTRYEWRSSETLQWKDKSGAEQEGELEVDENSPVFKLYDGSITIRYNPAETWDFYAREQLRYQLKRVVKIALIVLVGVGIFIVVVILRLYG